MAYDPSHESALDRIAHASSLPISSSHSHCHPIAGNHELELKVFYNPKGIVYNKDSVALEAAEIAFKRLMVGFKNASNGTKQNPSLHLDPAGLIPNDYILVSLGLDTVRNTLPTAEFFLNDMQYRLRFAINGLHKVGVRPNIGQKDANLKSLLSKMNEGEHRVELECVIHDDSCLMSQFKNVAGNPEFVMKIEDSDLKISEICMTSRTGFFILAKAPYIDAYVLFHGVYDVSRFTTPAMEVYTNPLPRIEAEFEAKLVIGDDPTFSNQEKQMEIINSVFDEIKSVARQNSFVPYSLSKMEDAALCSNRHYERYARSVLKSQTNILRRHSDNQSLPAGRVYALSRGISAADVFKQIAEGNSPLIELARGLPNPERLLIKNNPFCPTQLAA